MAGGRVLIVGAGAAGVFAAIRLKELSPKTEVTLLEASGRPLAKVRISGGGRCNVTHACYDLSALLSFYPRGGRALSRVLRRFGPADTVKWFEQRGVPLKREQDGRMFPTTDDSQTIIDCFQSEMERLGVRLFLRHRVTGLKPVDGGWEVALKDKAFQCDGVLLATGSAPFGYQVLESLDHKVVAPAPSLFTFQISDPRIQELSGVSVPQARVGLNKRIFQSGPLLMTHQGLSGPAVLRLSAFAARELQELHYQTEIWVDFLPAFDHQQVADLLHQRKSESKKKAANDGPFPLPKRLWKSLLAHQGLDPGRRWSEIPNKALNRLGEDLKRSLFPVRGKATFKDEFVTAGGLPLSELELETMQSRRHPGLFVAGELLDVDGVTGGFNFQNCWASGWVAAEGLARLSGK